MLLKATVCSAFYLLTIKSLTSSKSVLEEKFKYENWEITNSQRPVVSMTITDGDFKLLDSDETHKAYTWQGFIEGVTCNDYRHNPSYIFKCKAPFPIKWYIQTTFGKHFWGPDSQQFQNPLKTNETLNGLNFTYESVVSFDSYNEVLVKCMNVNHPDIFSTYDSYCPKTEVEDFEIDGPFMNNYEDNVRTIEISGTRANLLQWLTADPKWIRWQGGMENWPLILLPCPVRNHEDNAVLKYKLNDNYVRLPMESEENFEWNPQFGFVFRKEADPENYSTWKSTTFRCQVEYSYITVEPLGIKFVRET
ncbi:unnamed protein product [Allacma fusca]|uniref:Uncharacterized protein n=1 Tax=Allacma fusca TaxID=39272 RepID=A0A8J2J724_9HEXA|nr:unnamed protein product [Allacma fusca]